MGTLQKQTDLLAMVKVTKASVKQPKIYAQQGLLENKTNQAASKLLPLSGSSRSRGMPAAFRSELLTTILPYTFLWRPWCPFLKLLIGEACQLELLLMLARGPKFKPTASFAAATKA